MRPRNAKILFVVSLIAITVEIVFLYKFAL
jgi:hypothetical protein